VFSFLFSYPAAHIYFRHLGLTADFHDDLCHKEPGDQPSVNKGVVYTMACFAAFLEKLQAIPDGAGTLLDRACIYATSCVSVGKTHSIDDYPILIAGKAGGALRGNLHYRSTTKDNPSKVLLTMANAMGANLKQIGLGGGLASDELPAIRTA
jgi:hypothetical protein